MQKFGIEIRKVGDTKNLYNDVDIVLKRFGMQTRPVSNEAKVQTVAHALQRMLKSERHFSVCTVRDCAAVCQICIPEERMEIYRAVHCMDYSEMLPDYRQMLVAMLLDDFRTVLCQ